ncbi:peptidase S41 [Flavihumibacter sp. R14]|nr:peptidase S41 [Flavihumibacter soli]
MSFAQIPEQIENQYAFSKLYGYLKYFYPGDEAARINWDNFAIYGAQKTDACKTSAELKDSLRALIYPLMPGVKILAYSEQSAKMLTGSGTGHLWLRIDKKDKSVGFFNNMADNPISTTQWTVFSMKGMIDGEAAEICLGAFLQNNGSFAFDELSLKVEEEAGTYREVYHENFETESKDKAPATLVPGIGRGASTVSQYSFSIVEENLNRFVSISRVAGKALTKQHKELFETYPQVGEYIEKDLGSGLRVIIPLALYGTLTNTFPGVTDTLRASGLIKQINSAPPSILTADHLYTRIGNIINTWNVFQHFYPYFDIAKTSWDQDLKQAISEAYGNRNAVDFSKTLKKLTAKAKDGHVWVSFRDPDTYMPPVAWQWVEGQLVITSILDKALEVEVGSVVTKIDGRDPKAYFQDENQYISAATKGLLAYRAQTESLVGGKDSKLILTVTSRSNQVENLELRRNLTKQAYSSLLPKQDTIKTISPGITYISISNASMKDIDQAMPALQNSKAIICDLRGYPKDNTGLINYLMTSKDTSDRWMQIPRIIYPDQEKISGYQFERWPVKPGKVHLNAKIFFLTDGRAISYAESYMSFIEHYKLATIIGQPTAGTNGNVNRLNLPGGFSISFTGMKVLKHDGSALHGVGILPDIYVEQTVKGIRENRDEILERAIFEASK